jgi:hypothetical protein
VHRVSHTVVLIRSHVRKIGTIDLCLPVMSLTVAGDRSRALRLLHFDAPRRQRQWRNDLDQWQLGNSTVDMPPSGSRLYGTPV